MFYLLWALFNMALFLLLIYTCIRLTRIVNQKYGLFAAVIGVMLLLGNMRNNDTNNAKPCAEHWVFNNEDSVESNTHELIEVELARNWTNRRTLHISYAQQKNAHAPLPLKAWVSTSGWISGAEWQPLDIQVHTGSNNKSMVYYVAGSVYWSLLGVPVFIAGKQYSGSIPIP